MVSLLRQMWSFLRDSYGTDSSMSSNDRGSTPQWPYTVSEGRNKSLRDVLLLLKEFVTSEEFGNINGVSDELEIEHNKCSQTLQTAISDVVKDAAIVIIGTVSSGKSSLINTIVGKDILQEEHQHSTDKICRIKNSNSLKLVITQKNRAKREWTFTTLNELAKNSSFCSAKNAEVLNVTNISSDIQEWAKKSELIDIFLPLKRLKGDAFLVDTPGYEAPSATDLSECEGRIKKMNSIIRQYLPNAITCICVLNATSPQCIDESVWNLLEEIIENTDQMPCFDPKDVIFLVNKFDTVYDEKIWDIIKEAISSKWLPEDPDKSYKSNIFKFSLKRHGQDREYKQEYERFNKTLDYIVEKYQNRRILVHSRLADNVIQTINRSLLSRLKMCESTEKSNSKELLGWKNDCERLQEECQKKRTFLNDVVNTSLEDFSKRLELYIRSEGFKKEVMEEVKRQPEQIFENIRASRRVKMIFTSEIKIWSAREESILRQSLDLQIEKAYNDLDLKIKIIEWKLSGTKKLIGAGILVAQAAACWALSSSVFPEILISILLLGFFILGKMVEISFKDRDIVIEDTFNCLVRSCTHEKIRQALDKTIKYYKRKIDYLFSHQIPDKIKSIQATIVTLESQQTSILAQISEIKAQKCKLESIEKKLKDFI